MTAVAKRAARRGRRAIREGAVPTSMLVGSAALGWAQAKGHLNRLPTIGGSRALTIGLAGYAVTRLTTNQTARMIGRTAMIVGAFDWGSKQGGGKSALEGDDDWIEGEDEDDVEGEDENEI